MLEIKNIELEFKNQVILKDFSLNLKNHTITSLIAPSGPGKTTLFNAMKCFLDYKKGDVLYDGKSITNEEFCTNVSYMPENDDFYEELSGYENFVLLVGNNSFGEKEIENFFIEYNILDVMHMEVSSYDKMMKKKLAVMIVLNSEANYLFLDEPTVGEGKEYIKKYFGKLKNATQKGKTIIILTYVMNEADLCDDVILLHGGKVIAHDSYTKILQVHSSLNLNDAYMKLVRKMQLI